MGTFGLSVAFVAAAGLSTSVGGILLFPAAPSLLSAVSATSGGLSSTVTTTSAVMVSVVFPVNRGLTQFGGHLLFVDTLLEETFYLAESHLVFVVH